MFVGNSKTCPICHRMRNNNVRTSQCAQFESLTSKTKVKMVDEFDETWQENVLFQREFACQRERFFQQFVPDYICVAYVRQLCSVWPLLGFFPKILAFCKNLASWLFYHKSWLFQMAQPVLFSYILCIFTLSHMQICFVKTGNFQVESDFIFVLVRSNLLWFTSLTFWGGTHH